MATIINDDYSNTFDDYGHDDASGSDYRVTVVTTEVDPTAPLNGLRLNFRYRCFNDRYCRRLTSWYNLQFSGCIAERVHLDALSAFLDTYRVPLAARDDALRSIFNMYGGFGPIQATVCIYAFNYVPFDRRASIDEDFLFELDDKDDMERAMEVSAADFLGPKPASREAVEALEKVTIRAGVAEIRETSCTVCLEGFGFGFEVTRLPCSHAFHGDCIHRWLELRNFCPLCRFELPPAS